MSNTQPDVAAASAPVDEIAELAKKMTNRRQELGREIQSKTKQRAVLQSEITAARNELARVDRVLRATDPTPRGKHAAAKGK